MKKSYYAAVDDEELIGVLTAISVVSKRLAGNLIKLNRASQSKKGGRHETLRNKRRNHTPDGADFR
ncbi:MAG: hypothetical protein IK085_01285 [Clostridia bacterium]|nr:hypothetical protein [Clostridia bacterium]